MKYSIKIFDDEDGIYTMVYLYACGILLGYIQIDIKLDIIYIDKLNETQISIIFEQLEMMYS
jgi:hypothetical protein